MRRMVVLVSSSLEPGEQLYFARGVHPQAPWHELTPAQRQQWAERETALEGGGSGQEGGAEAE